MSDFFLIILGILVTGLKGLGVALQVHKTWGRWAPHWGGFKDSWMGPVWLRFKDDGVNPHTLTNLIVEWNRLDAQRGAKFMLGLALVGWALAIWGLTF